MNENKSIGQVAFEAFGNMGRWENIRPEIKKQWEKVGHTVGRRYVTQYDRREDAKKILEALLAKTDVLTLPAQALERMVDISLTMVDMLITKTNTDAFDQVQVAE